MIITKLSNTNPETLNAMACELESCVVERPEDKSLCDCRCNEQCPLKLPVFAKPSGTDRQNDQSDFLYSLVSSFDTAALELWKYESGTPVKKDDLNSNTYGTYYPLGTWTQYAGQEYYIGYNIEWLDVYNAFGTGEYFVKANLTILGNSQEINSDIFNLNVYSEQLADETVVIKTIQNGKVRRSRFDFTGMNWTQHIRLKGFFGFRTPELITDRFLNEEYQTTQIQDEIVDTYTLEINSFLNGSVSEDFIYSRMLANEIFVSDFNKCTTETYDNLPVTIEEFSETFEYRNHAGRAYVLKFKERAQDRFKRNFK